MKQFKFPHIGMRTTKTAVAVMLSYLIFVPFGLLYNESYPGVLAYVGPTYSLHRLHRVHAELPGADPPGWALPLCGGVHRCHPGGGYAAPGAPCCPTGWASS